MELLEVGEEQAGVGEPLPDADEVLVDDSFEVLVLGGIVVKECKMLLQTAFYSRIDPLCGVKPRGTRRQEEAFEGVTLDEGPHVILVTVMRRMSVEDDVQGLFAAGPVAQEQTKEF